MELIYEMDLIKINEIFVFSNFDSEGIKIGKTLKGTGFLSFDEVRYNVRFRKYTQSYFQESTLCLDCHIAEK